MLAFRLISEALNVSQEEGKTRWHQAQQRLRRRSLQLPPFERVKVPGARQRTPQLAANDAAKALRLVLKQPLEEFFGKEEKLEWLRRKVAEAGGDAATVDVQLAEMLEEKAQAEADAQSLVLPGLQSRAQMSLRTLRQDGEVLGSILDFLAQQSLPTPFTNFAGFRLLTKLCLHKSKIAQAMYDQALLVLGRVAVGDQRLHATLDANAAVTSEPGRAFVLGANEARAQTQGRGKKSAVLDLDALEKDCIEDDTLDVDVAARRLAKISLVRQNRESMAQSSVLAKWQKLVDVERYEAETKAAMKLSVEKMQAEKEVVLEKLGVERDEIQNRRATLQAERRAIEDKARADADDRERRRLHDAELALEKRRAQIRRAVEEGAIDRAAAEELLAENRLTPILRFEDWIRRRCGCPDASRCSSQLKRIFNEAIEAGRHIKPASHRDHETQRWKLYEEHDGAMLGELHRELHDRRNGVQAGQQRLEFGRVQTSS